MGLAGCFCAKLRSPEISEGYCATFFDQLRSLVCKTVAQPDSTLKDAGFFKRKVGFKMMMI